MTMAWKQEYIGSNPADTRRLEIAKIVTSEVEAFSSEEIAEILKMARLEPIHVHAVIATAIYTGARRGEIAGLKWEDVDFENRTMYIRRSVVKLVGQEPEIKLPKTISSIRQMAIPQALCDILQELKNEQDRKKALLGVNGMMNSFRQAHHLHGKQISTEGSYSSYFRRSIISR